jgi:DNA-binding MarR family transcriptional regulator
MAPSARLLPRAAPSTGNGTGGHQLEGVLAFLRNIWALDHALQLVSKRMERERGVTGQQRLLIRILDDHPGLSPGQLAETLHLDPSTVTGIVKRLERRRFVKRLSDPRDRRRVLVVLTEKGRTVSWPAAGTVEGVTERALASVPRTQLLAAEQVLRALTSVLQATLNRAERGDVRRDQ